MKVKYLKQLLENMDEDLPVQFKVDGFTYIDVSMANVSYIRKKVILE